MIKMYSLSTESSNWTVENRLRRTLMYEKWLHRDWSCKVVSHTSVRIGFIDFCHDTHKLRERQINPLIEQESKQLLPKVSTTFRLICRVFRLGLKSSQQSTILHQQKPKTSLFFSIKQGRSSVLRIFRSKLGGI